MNPLVTTIIPAFNAGESLQRAVQSVLDQAIDRAEIIIVNDGSTDATGPVAEAIALKDDRVWVIHQENSGVAAARNAGIEVARGDYLHFLDADDWMLPGGLQVLINECTSPDAPGAAGNCELFDEHCNPLHSQTGHGLGAASHTITITDLLERNRFQPAAAIVKRTLLANLRFDPQYSQAEDWDFWLRLAERGVQWRTTHQAVAAYRLRQGGLSRSFAMMASSSRRIIESAFERCRRHCTHIVPASSLRRENLQNVLRRSAVMQATACAWPGGESGLEAAVTILTCDCPHGRIPPSLLADAAYWMIPFADGNAPSAWRTTDPVRLRRYAAATSRLWRRLEAEGFISEGCSAGADGSATARAALAGCMISPDEIAGLLADRCRSASTNSGITLLGLGANAAPVARALAARGFRFDARDDRAAPGESFATIGGIETAVHGPGAPFNPEALHVMTVTDDAAYLASLPEGLAIIRWSDCRDALISAANSRLAEVWPIDPSRWGMAA